MTHQKFRNSQPQTSWTQTRVIVFAWKLFCWKFCIPCYPTWQRSHCGILFLICEMREVKSSDFMIIMNAAFRLESGGNLNSLEFPTSTKSESCSFTIHWPLDCLLCHENIVTTVQCLPVHMLFLCFYVHTVLLWISKTLSAQMWCN